MSAWGCPHEIDGRCHRVLGRACDPGMKGCILFGRFVWSNEAKNRPPRTSDAAASRRTLNAPPKADDRSD